VRGSDQRNAVAGAEEVPAATISITIVDKNPMNMTINPDTANLIVVR